jgi:hypothetical protein
MKTGCAASQLLRIALVAVIALSAHASRAQDLVQPREEVVKPLQAADKGKADSRFGGPNAESNVSLAFVGDVMLDTLPGELIEQGKDPFEHFAEIMATNDFVIANLECAVTTGGAAEDKSVVRAHPRCIPVLKRHLTAVSLANNHSCDYGKQAFVEQLERFDAAKLRYFGGGRNLQEASQPLILEKHGLRIALIGYNDFPPRSFAAEKNTPGVAWLVEERILEDIKQARERHRAHIVIPFLHWGNDYDAEPRDYQRQLARRMIEAGATAVIGGHAHVTQNVEYHEGRLIAYSLGNFIFDGFDRQRRPGAFSGWLLRLRLNQKGVAEWDTVVARLDDQGVPRPDFETIGPRGRVGSQGFGIQESDERSTFRAAN